ncbi:MAG: MarR family transcriptional regulator [Bacteroidetes bacterium]|nr:MarR family transcriptional regulator [Bacteroidota bacterium]
MSFIKELGTFAFGSRIKNFSDTLMRDMAKVYKELDVDFEPRWFTFFQLILERKEISVTQIAGELNQTHPAVVQVINILEKKKLIITGKDKNDNRRRLVKLSSKGKALADELSPLWEDVYVATKEMLNEHAPGFLQMVDKIEEALKEKSIYKKIKEKTMQGIINNLEFVEYEAKYLKDFQKLNKEWLKTNLELTEYDIKVLSDPYKNIIKNDGNIFFLVSEGKVLGTYALQRVSTKACELSKFTIKREYRGWNIGERMLEHAIQKAKDLKYESILLLTHPKLKEATQLYRKRGFDVIPEHPDLTDKTGRCSLYMQLVINQ